MHSTHSSYTRTTHYNILVAAQRTTHQEKRDAQGDDAGHHVVVERVLFAPQNLPHDHDGHDLEALRQNLLGNRSARSPAKGTDATRYLHDSLKTLPRGAHETKRDTA